MVASRCGKRHRTLRDPHSFVASASGIKAPGSGSKGGPFQDRFAFRDGAFGFDLDDAHARRGRHRSFRRWPGRCVQVRGSCRAGAMPNPIQSFSMSSVVF